MNQMSKRAAILTLFTVLTLGAFFRFYQITEIPLGLYPDEAMNGNNALEALAGGDFKIFYPENNGREGLFINMQAISLWIFGNEPWALRVVSALFGTLTILGLYLVTREIFSAFSLRNTNKYESTNSYIRKNSYFVNPEAIALLSTFFLATSYWHINFSRIGFRAIMIPFFTTFAVYFLLKGLRLTTYSSSEVEKLPNEKFSTGSNSIYYLILAGIFAGLGFHTYIAFRFMPFVFAVPILWYLWRTWKPRFHLETGFPSISCLPCAILLFIFVTFVAALPIGYYFLQNPQDFLGRGAQVSIFSGESPVLEFAKSNLATLGMFFYRGDCNWRHNYSCKPELHPLVALFFAMGLVAAVQGFLKRKTHDNRHPEERSDERSPRSFATLRMTLASATLLGWFIFMTLPATLTREGLPHALRSIGMIPPVMILSGLGAFLFIQKILGWFKGLEIKFSALGEQIARIRREVRILFIAALLLIPLNTYRNYFLLWAHNPNTYFSFATDIRHLGEYLNNLPRETKKYVAVNLPGVEVRGIPMSAQTVMFMTDTFGENGRLNKNIQYLVPPFYNLPEIQKNDKAVISFLNGSDRELMRQFREKYPWLKTKAPGDFVILGTE